MPLENTLPVASMQSIVQRLTVWDIYVAVLFVWALVVLVMCFLWKTGFLRKNKRDT
jgi:hypothetical protein